jgi:hypothetical protein
MTTPDEAAAPVPHAAASLLVAAARLDATLYPAAQEVQDALIALERERDSLRAREQAVRALCDRADRETFETSMFPGFVDTDDIRAALGPVETPQEETRG